VISVTHASRNALAQQIADLIVIVSSPCLPEPLDRAAKAG
jgi:hypothetical protein